MNHNSRVEVHPAVENLRGGRKQHWLRLNRQLVLDYYHQYGPEMTMQRFNIRRQLTLEAFLVGKPVEPAKLTVAEKALLKAEQAIEAYRENKHRINELEARIDDIEPLAEAGYSLLAALRKVAEIEFKHTLKVDPLDLADFGKSRNSEAKEHSLYLMESKRKK